MLGGTNNNSFRGKNGGFAQMDHFKRDEDI